MVVRTMPYKTQACGLTNTGLVRQNNEDYWDFIQEENFFVLADGMGGHLAGEVASKEAVINLCSLVRDAKINNLEEMRQLLRSFYERVNSIVYLLGWENDRWRGMGTTLCSLIIREEGAVVANVGDSRLYRLRSSRLVQITQDHSLLREMIDAGRLDEDKTEDFVHRNIITKAIGTEPCVDPSVEIVNVQPGDLFLLCTDGLTDLLARFEIEEILNKFPQIEEATSKLVHASLVRGGYDNITVILVKILNPCH